MKDKKYEITELTNIHDIDYSYCDHLDIDPAKSSQGWLLSLNAKEFKIVADFINEGEGDLILPIIHHFRRMPKIGDKISDNELKEASHLLGVSVSMIGLVKKGMFEYEVGNCDGEWKYTMTELGKEVKKELESNG